MKKIIVAVDGFSSCGKSTMAKTLAHTVGYTYLDTGAMYRAVTLYALRNGITESMFSELAAVMDSVDISFAINAFTGLTETYLNGKCVENEIRGMEVSQHVSRIASLEFVRTALVARQRLMGISKGIVMDGRDIGTVVFPDAELKIFVTASAEVRAQRRYDELVVNGLEASYADILNNVQQRDYLDTTRAVSPLRQAADAIVLDNTFMTVNQQNEWMLKRFEEATK